MNTCTVTGRADFSDRQIIRRIGRDGPGRLPGRVTGCYAQTNPDTVAALPGVDLVVGNQEKYRLPDLLDSLVKRARPAVAVADIREARAVPVAPVARMTGRSRPFVKIQDGCQHRCAFCIVPAARGGSRSQEPKVVLDQVRALAEAGYPDVTLTGVDIGHYGWDLYPRTSLATLVRSLASRPRPALAPPLLGAAVVLHRPISSTRSPRSRWWRRTCTCRSRAAATACCASCGGRTTPGCTARSWTGSAAAIPGLGPRRRRHRRASRGDRRGLRGDARARRARCPSPICTSSPTRTARAPRPPGARATCRARGRSASAAGGCGASAGRRATRSAAPSSARRARSWCWRRGTDRPACSPASRPTTSRCCSRGPTTSGERMATVEITEVRGDRTHGRLVEVLRVSARRAAKAPSRRSASSAAAGSTRWRASRTCAGCGCARLSARRPISSAPGGSETDG